jgi:hypothetical protein
LAEEEAAKLKRRQAKMSQEMARTTEDAEKVGVWIVSLLGWEVQSLGSCHLIGGMISQLR